MNEADQKLYRTCVRLMVEGVEALLEFKPASLLRNGIDIPLEVPYFNHMFTSDLEDYAELLLRLGILDPLVDPPGRACCFKLLYTPDEAENIAFEDIAERPSLERLLSSITYYASDRTGMPWDVDAEFPDNKFLHSLMPDLVRMGYAEATSDGYMWLPSFAKLQALIYPHWFEE